MENEELSPQTPDEFATLSAAYPELEALKAANETLREQGKEWLLTTLETICEEFNRKLTPTTEPITPPALQVGSQAWQFEVDRNVMVGERLGIRFRGQTLLVEVGWPRQPEHGIVPDLGLARARVSLSPNVMIDGNLLDELTLRRNAAGVIWQVLKDHRAGAEVTEETLRAYVQKATTE